MLLLCQSAFSQSKKEQIEILIFQKDSLGRILALERQLNTEQVKQLEAKITKINSDMGLILKELAQSKKDLTAKEEEIEKFRVGQVLWEDTIRSLREELHQIKASNFETFLPYFISEAVSGKNFDSLVYTYSPIIKRFIDYENLGFGRYADIHPFMSCILYDEFNYSGEWTEEGEILNFGFSYYENNKLPDLSKLKYFSSPVPSNGFGPADANGIYYKVINELKKSYWPTDGLGGWAEESPPSKLSKLKKMEVEIYLENNLLKNLYFVEFKNQWFLLYINDCFAGV